MFSYTYFSCFWFRLFLINTEFICCSLCCFVFERIYHIFIYCPVDSRWRIKQPFDLFDEQLLSFLQWQPNMFDALLSISTIYIYALKDSMCRKFRSYLHTWMQKVNCLWFLHVCVSWLLENIGHMSQAERMKSI